MLRAGTEWSSTGFPENTCVLFLCEKAMIYSMSEFCEV